MRKSTKVTLIIACILGVVGIGLTVGGAAMGATVGSVKLISGLEEFIQKEGFDFDDDGFQILIDAEKGDGETKTYSFESVSSMDIDLRYDEVYFKEHDDSSVIVEVYNDSRNNIKVEMDGKTLEIEGDKKVSNRVVTIKYPAGQEFENVEIEVDAGLVKLEDALTVTELDVIIGAGEFTNAAPIVAGQTDVEVGAGNVELKHLTVNQVNGDCGMGEMILELTGAETDYNYDLECGMGEIIIGNDSYGGVSNDKNINNQGASRNINLECGMGNIQVSFEK